MSNGAISRDTFDAMPVESKLGVLFDFAQEGHRCACATEEKVGALEKKFDRRKRVDTAVSGASGFVGGAMMIFIKWIVGK